MSDQDAWISLTTDLLPNKGQELRAGKLTVIYERGIIRHARSGSFELVNMIYGAVRLSDWSTPEAVISGEAIIVNENSFRINYTADYFLSFDAPGNHIYQAVFLIEGFADSSIRYSMKGQAVAGFTSNRVGICVLHPVKEHAGRESLLTLTDDRSQVVKFPIQISPHQPFTGFKKMQWITDSNEQVILDYEGAVFETEDQRNWSDYSYKTYSGPLADPWPFDLKAGERCEQTIRLRLNEHTLQHSSEQPVVMDKSIADMQLLQANVSGAHQQFASEQLASEQFASEQFAHEQFTHEQSLLTDKSSETNQKGHDDWRPMSSLVQPELIAGPKSLFPLIGFGLPQDLSLLEQPGASHLLNIHFNLFRLTVNLAETGWQQRLRHSADLAAGYQVQLEIMLILDLSQDQHFRLFIDTLQHLHQDIYSITILSGVQSVVPLDNFNDYRAQLKAAWPQIRVGYGTAKYFADLNRNRPAETHVDYLQFGLSPQVHAFDSASMFENLATLPWMISQARAMNGSAAIHVSPLCFDSEFTPSKMDQRNNSSLQACWFINAIARLAGAEVISLFALDAGESFLSIPDPMQSPFFRILTELKKFQPVYTWHVADTRSVWKLENKAGMLLQIAIPSEYQEQR